MSDAAPPPRPGRLRRIRRRLRYLPRDVGYFWAPRVASWFRKRWVLMRNPHADLRFGKHVYCGPGFSIHVPFEGTMIVGDGVEFRRNFRVELASGARLEIGTGTRFTYDSIIQCGRSIKIGERVMFGQASMLVDGNHRFRDLTKPMLEQGYDLRPVVIEDDVTTTTKCTILASIGTRSFIGANSVVTKDIPAYVVAAGMPAKVLEYFGPPGQEPPELAAS